MTRVRLTIERTFDDVNLLSPNAGLILIAPLAGRYIDARFGSSSAIDVSNVPVLAGAHHLKRVGSMPTLDEPVYYYVDATLPYEVLPLCSEWLRKLFGRVPTALYVASAKMTAPRCNRCHRPMPGTTACDGACSCGGLIEETPARDHVDPSRVTVSTDRYMVTGIAPEQTEA
jgi:hypothetical protein